MLTAKEFRNALEAELLISHKALFISAFVSDLGAQFALDSFSYHKKLTIIGRFLPNDFISNASSLEALITLTEHDVTVKILPNLHAKLFIMDERIAFTGSANLTGKGLGLVENANFEGMTRLVVTEQLQAFAKSIADSSIELSKHDLLKMKQLLDSLLHECGKIDIPKFWPETIITKKVKLSVTHFPLSAPFENHVLYDELDGLEFSCLYKTRMNYDVSKQIFKKSIAFGWLKNTLNKYDQGRGLNFGMITAKLHNDLCDSPAPYRRDVKILVANLIAFVENYAQDEISITRPGRRTKVLSLLL
jgi:hypothetical protein